MRAFPLLAALCVAVGCGDDNPPPDDRFDGNVVIGDARVPDATIRDARPADGGFDDIGVSDAGVQDTGGLDASRQDTGRPLGCEAPATQSLSASEVLARLAELDGTVIDVVGTATAATPNCTAMACPGFDPCCNTCQSELVIDDVLPLASSECIATVGCTGDECSMVCVPFIASGTQTFRGEVASDPARLLLHSVE